MNDEIKALRKKSRGGRQRERVAVLEARPRRRALPQPIYPLRGRVARIGNWGGGRLLENAASSA